MTNFDSATATTTTTTTGTSAPEEELESVAQLYLISNKLADLYVSFRGKFVMMGTNGSIFTPNRKDGDRLVPVKLSNSVLYSHAMQSIAVSVFSGPYAAKFLCFDVDDGSLETVKAILDVCEESGIPRNKIYVNTSGGKGYHVEIFFDRLVYVSKMKRFYEWACRKAKLNREKVELRPTPRHSIKLPLSKNFKTGRVCWFLDTDTFEPIERQDYILEVKKVSGDTFDLIADSVFKEITVNEIVIYEEEKPEAVPVETIHIQGDELISLTQSGMMHKAILSIAIYLRNRRYSQDEITARLHEWIEQQNPDYITDSSKEIKKQIRDAVSWVFSPKFHLVKAKNVEFFASDIKDVLRQKTKLERKITFLLMYFDKRCGTARVTYERMGKICDVTVQGAIKAVKHLEEVKMIRRKLGEWRKTDTGFMRDVNSYWVNFTDRSCKGTSCIIDNMPDGDDFNKIYYTTLATLADRKELKAHLSRAEYKKLEEIVNGVHQESVATAG